MQHIEDAEKCLLAGTELRLRDQIIDTHRALHKNEVGNKKSLKEQRIKDTRNLYLVKEGGNDTYILLCYIRRKYYIIYRNFNISVVLVVLAGNPAAVEVSISDMEKRLKLERWKSQMLRNLNMFVSRVRLAVHNLPSNLDDAKLRQLFKNHSGSKAVIKEVIRLEII